MIQDRLEDGWRPWQHADPLLNYALHDRQNVKDGVGDDGGPAQHTGENARLEPRGVEERVHDEIAVTPSEAHQVRPRDVRLDTGTVTQDSALRPSGRSRREDD